MYVTYNIINSSDPFLQPRHHDGPQCYPTFFLCFFLFGLISLDCGVIDDFVSTVICCDTNEFDCGELRMRPCKEALLLIIHK